MFSDQENTITTNAILIFVLHKNPSALLRDFYVKRKDFSFQKELHIWFRNWFWFRSWFIFVFIITVYWSINFC